MALNSFFERLLAGRWIAGPSIQDAVDRTEKFNRKGIGTILNYLGEDFRDKGSVEQAVEKYLKLIKSVHDSRIKADISVKPTQIGLSISYRYASANYARILDAARHRHLFVWLDMEDHRHVDRTIRLYLEHLKARRKKDTGICIQAYLRRSGIDMARIVGKGGVIRLVKGAYRESARIAYGSKKGTDENYSKLMKYLFDKSDQFTIATHDAAMIEQARHLQSIRHRNVTFAMLNGIRDKYAENLARKHMKVYIYVPFGERWVDYSLRRLHELSNALLVIRSLFSR